MDVEVYRLHTACRIVRWILVEDAVVEYSPGVVVGAEELLSGTLYQFDFVGLQDLRGPLGDILFHGERHAVFIGLVAQKNSPLL